MSLFLAAAVSGVIFGYAAGGSLRGVIALPIPKLALAFVWLAVPLRLWPAFGNGENRAAFASVIASYVLIGFAIVAAIGFFRRSRWLAGSLAVIAVGWFANFAVIAANGGMPASRAGIERLGHDPDRVLGHGVPERIEATEETRLRFLGDVVIVPPRWLISIGDIALLAGIAAFLAAAMRAEPSRVRISNAA